MELQAEAQREECSNHLEDQFKPGDEVWATAFCGGTVQRMPATVKGYTAVGLLVVTDSGLMFAYRKDGSSLTAICTAPLQMRGSTATDIAIEIQNVLSDSRIDEVSRG